MEPTGHRAPARSYAIAKRGIDLIGGLLLLTLTAPILLLALAAVLLSSGPPLIHRRRVVGRHGHVYDAYKIRTMVRDADQLVRNHEELRDASTRSRKLAGDPRVSRLGKWLRRTSIDELPQLVNVMRGEMSLVGPRMLTAEELTAWGSVGQLVLAVRPGLTGLWQVSGRQDLSREDRIRLDGEYVQHISLALDIRILARTLPVVMSGRGAL